MANQVEKYSSRIYQLDELIQDLYNAVYSKSGKYKTKFIDIADIHLSRFKMSDYDLDVIFERTPIQYVGNYSTGIMVNGKNIEQIWIKRKGETHMCTIRIVPYISDEAVNDITDPVNVNQVIKTIMSELVVNDRTNNLLLPIINIDIKGSDLVEYPKIEALIDKNKFYSIQITEKFYSLTTLDNFLKSYPLEMRVLKTIIYQAVDVLYQISISYPGFRYNQFIPEMIDCYLKTNDDIVFPELKLSEFYLSEINEVVSNKYLKSSQLPIPFIDSSYSDLYQLLNYLWNHNNADIKKYPELVTLFDVILPKKIRSSDIYLTDELWNLLSEEEKFDLRLKNIRNNTFFTSKDSLLNTKFVETKDISDLTGGISESEDNKTESELRSDHNLSGNDRNIKTRFGDESPEKTDDVSDGLYDPPAGNISINTNTSNDNSRINKNIRRILNTNKNALATNSKNSYSDDQSELHTISENSTKKYSNQRQNSPKEIMYDDMPDLPIALNTDEEVYPSNKKYSNNDIDNMSNKNSNRKNNSTRSDFSDIDRDYTLSSRDAFDDLTEERTEERTEDRNKDDTFSRIINVSDSDIGLRRTPKNKLKTYHGQRRISGINDTLYQKDRFEQPTNINRNNQQQYDNTFLLNGVASRVNSIGSALGVTPNDFNNRNQTMGNTNYPQIAQQMAQTFNSDPNILPGHLPPNMPSQIPTQIQNPLGQSQMTQQPDMDAYLRYMSATGQMPSQSQAQLDPAMFMYMQQQNNAQNQLAQLGQMSQMTQVPQMGQMPQMMPTMAQTGGAKRNPFFFQ
ncbi:hypothetical protein QJ856_gp0750 [Tupanvirus deep ocean]|uniref:Uncharacterized protein n=2 Tax=Tupanvirus TaxID=2094720 RepID=A0AC62A8L1_9VIRU|nr:hypothetical protein QJ856_gp0750 [Tupanvirus deep ocean]QKU34002.1 hypothetical protein [Tupanvirus deep ocean]